MAIEVTCECGKSVRVKDEHAGRAFRCPDCGGTVQVPAPTVFVPKPPVRSRRRLWLAVAVVAVLGLAPAAWYGVSWWFDNTPEKIALRRSYAKAKAEKDTAIVILNEAERRMYRGDREDAIKKYAEYLAHPGSSAMGRHVDEDRKAKRESPKWLFVQENQERELDHRAATERTRLTREIVAEVSTCWDGSDPNPLERFDREFGKYWHAHDIDPSDRSLVAVQAYDLLREKFAREHLAKLAATADQRAAAEPEPQPDAEFEAKVAAAEEARRNAESREDMRMQREWEVYNQAYDLFAFKMRNGLANHGPPEIPVRHPTAAAVARKPPASKPEPNPEAETLYRKARDFELLKRYETAKERYHTIVRNYPGTEAAVKAKERLNALGRPHRH